MCITTTTYNGCFHRENTTRKPCYCNKKMQDKLVMGCCPLCVQQDRPATFPPRPPMLRDQSLTNLVRNGQNFDKDTRKSLLSAALEDYPHLDGIISAEEDTGIPLFTLGFGDMTEYDTPPFEPAPVDLRSHKEWLEKERAFTNRIKDDASQRFEDKVQSKRLEEEPAHRRWSYDPNEQNIATTPQWRIWGYRNMGMRPEWARRLNTREDDTTLSRKIKALQLGYSADINGEIWHGGVDEKGKQVPSRNMFFDGRYSHKFKISTYAPYFNPKPFVRRGPPPDVVWEESDTESESESFVESVKQPDEFLTMANEQGMAGKPGKPVSHFALQNAAEDEAEEEANEVMSPIRSSFVLGNQPIVPRAAPNLGTPSVPIVIPGTGGPTGINKEVDNEKKSAVALELLVRSVAKTNLEEMSLIKLDASKYLSNHPNGEAKGTTQLETANWEASAGRRRGNSCIAPPSLESILERPEEDPTVPIGLKIMHKPVDHHHNNPGFAPLSRSPSTDSSDDEVHAMPIAQPVKPMSSLSYHTDQSTPTPISAIRAAQAQYGSRFSERNTSPQEYQYSSSNDYNQFSPQQKRQESPRSSLLQGSKRGSATKGSSISMNNFGKMVQNVVAKRNRPQIVRGDELRYQKLECKASEGSWGVNQHE